MSVQRKDSRLAIPFDFGIKKTLIDDGVTVYSLDINGRHLSGLSTLDVYIQVLTALKTSSEIEDPDEVVGVILEEIRTKLSA